MSEYPYDDEVFLLIGRIIAEWSNIHEWIHNSIGRMQTRIYMLQKGDWCAQHGPHGWNRNHGEERVIPDTKFKLRLRYYRRLARALAGGSAGFERELNAATKDLGRLYGVRNDLAHSIIRTGPYWEAPYISLSSREWSDKWERDFQKDGVRRGRPIYEKTYSLDDLRQVLAEMRASLMALVRLHPDIPGHVPEQPKPPV